MTAYTPPAEAVEAAAKAMADDWSPDRDPILTAMFRDYAMSALTAAGPIIAAEVERLREGVFAAATVLNREFYRRPATWVERLAADLRALLARGEGS